MQKLGKLVTYYELEHSELIVVRQLLLLYKIVVDIYSHSRLTWWDFQMLCIFSSPENFR